MNSKTEKKAVKAHITDFDTEQNVLGLFATLKRIDMRLNPENYIKDSLPANQTKQ